MVTMVTTVTKVTMVTTVIIVTMLTESAVFGVITNFREIISESEQYNFLLYLVVRVLTGLVLNS